MGKMALTNSDKMLQTVLSDEKLIEYGNYNPEDYDTADEALCSDNPIVVAVAKLINGVQRNYTSKEIYDEVRNYLTTNL
mgnify:FL=1